MIKLYKENNMINFKFIDKTLSAKDIKKICSVTKKTKINWSGNIRFEPVFDYELAKTMKKGGCKHIFVGLETASKELLSKMNKQIDIENASEILENCHKNDIKCKISIMFNFPGETIDDVKKTINFIKKNKVFINKVEYGFFTLTKGSKVYTRKKDFNIKNIVSSDFNYFCKFEETNISEKEINEKQELVREFIQWMDKNNKISTNWDATFGWAE